MFPIFDLLIYIGTYICVAIIQSCNFLVWRIYMYIVTQLRTKLMCLLKFSFFGPVPMLSNLRNHQYLCSH